MRWIEVSRIDQVWFVQLNPAYIEAPLDSGNENDRAGMELPDSPDQRPRPAAPVRRSHQLSIRSTTTAVPVDEPQRMRIGRKTIVRFVEEIEQHCWFLGIAA